MPETVGKVYHDKGDRWLIRLKGGVRIFCDKSHRTFYSRQHAQLTLSQICAEIENGVFDESFYSKTKKSEYSFSVYALEWLAGCEKKLQRGELSPTYLKDLRRFVKRDFIPFFQDESLLEIKGRRITAFYNSLEGHPKTLFNKMSVLHKMFQDALYGEVIPAMPNFPKQGHLPEPDTEWISEDIQDNILGYLKEDDAFAIYFMMCHGTRTGEARALQHRDINLETDTVIIRRSFSGQTLRETTKTKRARIVPLDQTWKDIYLSRPPYFDPEGFVFHKQGEPLSESWLRKKWNDACREAGIKGVNLKGATRHSVASQAASRGESLYLISKFLGHTNSKMTERYAHVAGNALRTISRKNNVHTFPSKHTEKK
jgi:integrase/recombinase XerD